MSVVRSLRRSSCVGLVLGCLGLAACAADPATPDGGAGSDSGGTNASAGMPAAGTAGISAGGSSAAGSGTVAGNAGAPSGGSPAGGGGSGGGASMTMLVQPVQRADKMVLEFGSTWFEVTPGHGARVTSLKYAGQELLSIAGPADAPEMYGSTFWPSPQSLWNWPPPAQIDNAAYAATVDAANLVTAVGTAFPALTLSVTKKFNANLPKEAVEIEYTMTNSGAAAVSAAPWEITRMPATGIAFWPTGGAPFKGTMTQLATEDAAGHTWCTPGATAGEAKVFADGMGGWLAYVVGDLLLIKQFPDQPATAAAANEAEIELYINPAHSYVEVEQQGAYAPIAPAASVSWKVTWYARKLPSGVTATVGNADLIAFVTQTLQ